MKAKIHTPNAIDVLGIHYMYRARTGYCLGLEGDNGLQVSSLSLFFLCGIARASCCIGSH